MRVLHMNPSFLPGLRDGGPTVSVLHLAQGLKAAGVHVDLVTTNRDGPLALDVPLGRPVMFQGIQVTYFRRYPNIEFTPSVSLVRHVAAVARNYDLVHVHAVFTFTSTACALVLRRLGVPYVMSPRGMCQPWAMAQKRLKKWPYWVGLERPNLRAALGVHATSEEEEQALRNLLPEARIFTVPNAVELPTVPDRVQRERRRVLFLGRLHPVKGFDVLIPAMSLLSMRLPDVELWIAGPDDHGELQKIRARAAACRPEPRVHYVGAVEGVEKTRLLASAATLVLTSHTESFGRAVVEALGCGTPAVVGRTAPWRSLDEAGAGYWVANEPKAIADALERVLTAPDEGASLHLAARALAARYTPASVGMMMAAAYANLVATLA